MTGILIAGISGAGKTTLHRRVTAAVAASQREIMVAMPQAMTTTAHLHLWDNRKLQAETILAWCDDLISFFERVHKRVADGLLKDEPYAYNWVPILLVEGFIFDIPLHGFAIKREETLAFEERLARLGVKLVVLRIPDEQIVRQAVASTRHNRGEGWRGHLHRLGENDEAIGLHFRRQQERLLEWAQSSPMSKTVISTAEGKWDEYARTIVDLIDK